jgi:hypothetical protein
MAPRSEEMGYLTAVYNLLLGVLVFVVRPCTGIRKFGLVIFSVGQKAKHLRSWDTQFPVNLGLSSRNDSGRQ